MTLSGIGDLPLFKRRTGAEELEALLDLLPQPTLVADGRSGHVLFANAEVTQLTAYTRRELSELELSTLLPDLDPRQAASLVSPAKYKLVTRSSRSQYVAVKAESLGGPDHWIALRLLPPTPAEQDPRVLQQQRWEAMHMLMLANQQDELSSSFHQILQAGLLLTGASSLALYQRHGSQLTLKNTGGDFAFPTVLQDADVAHIRTPKVWQPGKPIESPLHKLAHAAKVSFMATAPFDVAAPETGLIVAVGTETSAAPDLLTLLQILAATAAASALRAEATGIARRELQKLAGSDEISHALQEQTQDGILFADGSLNIVEINPAAEAMLGYATSEVKGKPTHEVLISNQALLPMLETVLEQGKAVEIGERKLHRRDGTEFLAFIRIAPINNPGAQAKLAVLFTDLSEHEAFHLQSQQLQHRAWLGEITAYFAHEVRNPINNISTGLQLMQMNLPAEDPMQEQIKRLQEDCDRLEHRIKSVLSFSRNLEHHPEPLDIGEFCRMQLERWRPRMARKGISDHLQIAPETPTIYGDRRALDQVFTNLITNAIQAMQDQESGILAMKIRQSPDDPTMVDIHVSDSGPGIPEELRQRVFEPFFTTKRDEGTGLGLAITRRIIMMHKGTIDLESFPGGTLFKIQLPVAPVDGSEVTKSE